MRDRTIRFGGQRAEIGLEWVEGAEHDIAHELFPAINHFAEAPDDAAAGAGRRGRCGERWRPQVTFFFLCVRAGCRSGCCADIQRSDRKRDQERLLDPFMGSGTTAEAALRPVRFDIPFRDEGARADQVFAESRSLAPILRAASVAPSHEGAKRCDRSTSE
jgi:hypothetical protein